LTRPAAFARGFAAVRFDQKNRIALFAGGSSFVGKAVSVNWRSMAL
jgi:hypothetical protein